jgi:Ca-activated chloride channel family protein
MTVHYPGGEHGDLAVRSESIWRSPSRWSAGAEPALVVPAAVEVRDGALPSLWARMKIASLTDLGLRERGADTGAQIRALALEFGLISQFTAFLAVDSTSVTAGDHGVTVPVAVPVPHGVRYDTTVK